MYIISKLLDYNYCRYNINCGLSWFTGNFGLVVTGSAGPVPTPLWMLIGLMHVQGLTNTMFLPCTDSIQPGWFLVKNYMCGFGLWFANMVTVKMLSDTYEIIKYVTFYDWTNRLKYFSTYNLKLVTSSCKHYCYQAPNNKHN